MSKRLSVIINLGTPKTTALKDIRRYLRQFLMDPYVIDKPFWFRWILVNGIIVNFRSPTTRKSYQAIWQKEGSPLKIYTEKLAQILEKKAKMKVLWAMRYDEPSIENVMKEVREWLKKDEITKVVFVPLYPQWAMSTYLTVEEEVNKSWKSQIEEKLPNHEKITKVITPVFYHEKGYLKSLSASIRPYLKKKWQKIIFSYHGIPESHIKKSDPSKSHCLKKADCCEVKNSEVHPYCYRHQVLEVTKLVAKELKLKENDYLTTFQSRLGSDPWLTPFTDKTLKKLAKEGIKNLIVVCPSFISDNLETLFENGIENREFFMEALSPSLRKEASFTLVPCLNLAEDWSDFLSKKISSI